jgi:uncharacterized protein (TIGR02266 family)
MAREARYQVDIVVNYETRDLFLGSRVTNISCGGLFIRTDDPLPIQTELDLQLHLPGEPDTVRARGRVIWNYDMPRNGCRLVSGMGIKFVGLMPEQRARLEASLQRLSGADREGLPAQRRA